MGTTSAATFVKKSVGWSIALSVLMIVAGILAIASPLAAGIAVTSSSRGFLFSAEASTFCLPGIGRAPEDSCGSCCLEFCTFIGGYLLMHPVAGLGSLRLRWRFTYWLKPFWSLCWDSRFAASGVRLAACLWDIILT